MSLVFVSAVLAFADDEQPFPEVSAPRAVTSGPKDHLLASYFAINSHSPDFRYLLVLETDVNGRLPEANERCTLGLVDLEDGNRFIPVTTTACWNFQEAAMGHWMDQDTIVFNDVRDGKFVTVVMNWRTKAERILPRPISALSEDRRWAVSINYARLSLTRPDYGYAGPGQDALEDAEWPEDDGLWVMDMQTGESKLILSVAQGRSLMPPTKPEAGKPGHPLAYYCHTVISKDGAKIFFLARSVNWFDKTTHKASTWETTSFTINRDGTELRRCYKDGWAGSHFNWAPDGSHRMLVTAIWDGDKKGHWTNNAWSLTEFTVGEEEKVRRIGAGILDQDWHCVYRPDGKFMSGETYWNKNAERPWVLTRLSDGVSKPLGAFAVPKQYRGGYWRCDLHARWRPDGRQLVFNSVHEGSRQVYVMDLWEKGERQPGMKLPGEDGDKPALSPAPFPNRMSAYVWRNWGLVDPRTLADVVGATVEDLAAVAEQMGLDPNPTVLPEWRRKGYITILRRNWHLLTYDQIMKLLGFTREQLHFSLIEDDFLWVKMGRVKPNCQELRWFKGMREACRGERERLAAVLKEEGLDPKAKEEPRFTFVKDISKTDPAFSLADASNGSQFDFRLIFSYFANYIDPLGDPEIGSFPDGLLQKLSAQGVNAVWLHTVLRTLAKDPKYPEFGEGCEKRMVNLQKLVDRCAKYGIRVFLYMNEPRGLSPEFFRKPGRESLAGATHDVLQAMCTLNPETQRWLSDSLEKVFSTVHGLGGIFTITASENLTNCATRPGNKETCPVCKSHSRGEIIAAANSAMIRGMLKGDPNAEALIWNWAWPKEEEHDIVSRLPLKGCRLMAVSENAMEICRGGVKVVEGDYSISIVGPGENAKRFWGFAKERGLPAVAKVQAATSWEIAPFPYIPTMDLVVEHAVNLSREQVRGVMLSWSLGCCPSPNLSVYREVRPGETDKDAVLDRLAKRIYGDKAAQARKAWKAFSDGFAQYPFSTGTIYVAPHHWGPVNPLYPNKTGYSATMVGIPYDSIDSWRTYYPRETYAELIGKVADGFEEGCRLMEGVADAKELAMFKAEQMHFASCRDQSLFVMARDRGDRAAMRKYAKIELDRAKAYWPIVRADSRIGFESSCQYFFVPRDVLEKVLTCRAVLDAK